MAIKYRTAQNYKTAYESNKQGIAIGIENFIHLKKEVVAGTFYPPSVGTQGDFTGLAVTWIQPVKKTLTMAVDGGTPLLVTLDPLNCVTEADAAEELETVANAALAASGQDGRVWVNYTTKFIIYSQKTGSNSSVNVTAGTVGDDIRAELFLTGGTATAGTGGGNFLFMTKAGLKVSQPFEMSQHRTGRQASNIIKKKIVAEGDIEMYFNMDTTGGSPNIDTPVEDILENVLGRKTVTGSLIKFDAVDPGSSFLSIQQGNNTFARSFNGCYGKSLKISLPGDGEAKMTIPFKSRDGK